MSRTLGVVILIVIVVLGLGLALTKKDSSKNSNNQTNTNQSQQESTKSSQNSSSTQTTATNKVSIVNMSFSPADITVKKGTAVTWTNDDSIAHTVVETDGKSGPKSSSLNPGESYSFTYNETGTFSYHCSIHPTMTGTVTVTE